jgi:hypothetical protein
MIINNYLIQLFDKKNFNKLYIVELFYLKFLKKPDLLDQKIILTF